MMSQGGDNIYVVQNKQQGMKSQGGGNIYYIE